ncbi:MAG TPA: META domain-containing protein [Vicinamibacterales bacterium]
MKLSRAACSTMVILACQLAAGCANRDASMTGANDAAEAAPTAGLAGTSWQLVEFQGSDDTTLRPDDSAKYTLEFHEDGRLTARIDCNRGMGTWSSSGPGQITLNPMALTRAQCPEGSLHDQIVKQLEFITSYVIRDGHLFLALKADGGIYEFRPATP